VACVLALKQTIREFTDVCEAAGVQASLYSDPDEVFKLEMQPVRRLDFLVDDPTTARAACRKAAWATVDDVSFARNGIVVRMHNEEESLLNAPASELGDTDAFDTPLTVHYFGLDLLIEPGVYEPDPGSATFVRQTLAEITDRKNPVVVDIGTGSGSIALAIAHARNDARVIGSDISDAAVTCAANNATRLGITNAVFANGALFEAVPEDLRGRVDVVVANMPWMCALEVAISRLEETHWRGPLSTVCGTDVDGMGLVRDVAHEARGWLRESGILIVMAYRWQLEQLSSDIAAYYDAQYVEADQLLVARLKSAAMSHVL
jgi:release factor glutamine methyltransferase